MTSIAEVRKNEMAKYNTSANTYKDFPVGANVEVITPHQDFSLFNHERGTVIENGNRYLGIIVKFDEKYKRSDFNFNPEDLYNLGDRITVRRTK